MKVGLSGERGSFSEQAAQEYCRKNKIENPEFVYLISVKNTLDALRDGRIELGIFPIENSNGGIVIESIYAMADHIFKIEVLFEIPVLHCLMVKPGTKKEDIKLIASHDQALKQCKMYLRRQWPNVALEATPDTAGTAKDISEGKFPPTTAAIAAENAAKLYGLEILEKGIQDLKFNFTSFLAVRK